MKFQGVVQCPCYLEAPFDTTGTRCASMIQAVWFEGVLSLAAGLAGHLQTVHGLALQVSWRVANRAVE